LLDLLAGSYLLGHVVGEIQHAINVALRVAQWVQVEVEVHLLRLPGTGKVKRALQLAGKERLTGLIHPVEQPDNAQRNGLRRAFAKRPAQKRAVRKPALVGRVHELVDVVGPMVHSHVGGQLHEHLLEALALLLGLGAGLPLGGLAFAQGFLHRSARLVAGIGEADQQPVAAPPGRHVKVVIEAVGLVVEVAAAGFARLEHAPVKPKRAVGVRIGKARTNSAAGTFPQSRHALGRRIQVFEGEIH
jgi:hypothetical protein